jgi:Na+/H+-dicarboxylate symporter
MSALGFIRRLPNYLWTFLALIGGIILGGLFPEGLSPVVTATRAFIEFIILVVPALIFFALAPAIATLIRRGLAGRFAISVVGWYVFSSFLAGLFGLAVAALVFSIPLTQDGDQGIFSSAVAMLSELKGEGGVTGPVLAVVVALVVAVMAVWIERLYSVLRKVELAVAKAGAGIAFFILPLIIGFGVTIGATFGARMGMGQYGLMVLYTAGLCLVWWAFYVFVVLGWFAGKKPGPILREYYVPTALFAAGTCSSLATLPVNIYQAKKYGVRDEVADFVIPFGAVVNMDASALAYMAYAPFVISHIFGLEISWVILIVAWPVLVVYSLAAPGLPAGMGTALWSSVLFAALLGLEDPERSTFIATWLALSGGIPDMLRTATNCTGDGFVAILFDSKFDEFFAGDAGTGSAVPPESVRPPVPEGGPSRVAV